MTTPEERRARRVWIAAHHPDRGGDPRVFAAGLAAFAREDAATADAGPVRPRATVVRSRGPVRTLRRIVRRAVRARRRRTHHRVL